MQPKDGSLDKNKLCGIISWVMIALFVAVSTFAVTRAPKLLYGDGYEYILLTQAFENHGTFDIREADVRETIATFPKYSGVTERAVTDFLIYDKSDDLRTYHFGAYSAIASPFVAISEKAGADPVYGFYILNIILWVLSLLSIKLLLKADEFKKLLLVLLLTVNPAWFYLAWIHSEIYLFSLIVIALVCRYNKWYAPAILVVSLAALQNVGVMPLAMFIGIKYIRSVWDDVKELWPYDKTALAGKLAKRILPYGLLFVPAFIPYILNYIHFRRFSPMADSVMVSEDFGRRAVAYLFDPNMGLIVYAPVVFVVFVIMAVRAFIKREKLFETAMDLGALLIILIIIGHEKQINCDMFGIMRYNVWILPILIFHVVMFSGDKRLRDLILSVVSVAFTGFIVGYVMYSSNTFSYVEFAPWTKTLLNNAPWEYNPPTGIFYSRATGGERYDADTAVGYSDTNGNVHKILLSSNASISDSWFIVSPDGDIIDTSNYDDELNVMEYSPEYEYINISDNGYRLYQRLDRIDYVGGDVDVNPGAGIYNCVGGYAWASDDVYVALPGRAGCAVEYEFTFVPQFPVNIDIYANDKPVKHIDNGITDRAVTCTFIVEESLDINYIHIESDVLKNNHEPNMSFDTSWQLRYLGEVTSYTTGDRILLNSDMTEFRHSILTDVYYEPDGTWSGGTTLRFAVNTEGSDMIDLRINNVLGGSLDYQLVVNDREIEEGTLYAQSDLYIPVSDGLNVIEIRLPGATTPRDLGMSSDYRMLGIRMSYIDIL